VCLRITRAVEGGSVLECRGPVLGLGHRRYGRKQWLAGKTGPWSRARGQQGGQYVARHDSRPGRGAHAAGAFRLPASGSLATIGRKSAVADFGWIKIWGAPAWWLWGFFTWAFWWECAIACPPWWNWFWAYLTFGGGIRLITGAESIPAVAHDRPDPQS